MRFEEEFDDETKVIEESTIDQIGRGSTRENIFQECSVVGEHSEMILVAEESEEITIEEADTTDLEEASEAQISSTEIVVEDLHPDVVTPSIKLIVFNILLPTVDVFLDSALVQKLFLNGYWGSSVIVTTGILTNFLFSSLAWWRLEPAGQKKWSWIFLVLQLWPQLKAFQVRN